MIVFILIYHSDKLRGFKENGIRSTGTIIDNGESGAESDYRLGGNINNPTIKFVTESGEEIIGKPVTGFISQHEIIVPSSIDIIYDAPNPQRFSIDTGD